MRVHVDIIIDYFRTVNGMRKILIFFVSKDPDFNIMRTSTFLDLTDQYRQK